MFSSCGGGDPREGRGREVGARSGCRWAKRARGRQQRQQGAQRQRRRCRTRAGRTAA